MVKATTDNAMDLSVAVQKIPKLRDENPVLEIAAYPHQLLTITSAKNFGTIAHTKCTRFSSGGIFDFTSEHFRMSKHVCQCGMCFAPSPFSGDLFSLPECNLRRLLSQSIRRCLLAISQQFLSGRSAFLSFAGRV
jgi:hypothetical protein